MGEEGEQWMDGWMDAWVCGCQSSLYVKVLWWNNKETMRNMNLQDVMQRCKEIRRRCEHLVSTLSLLREEDESSNA